MATIKKTAEKGEQKEKSKVGRVAGQSAVPENETKEDRFKRLVVRRVTKTLSMIKNIGNCSNKSVYGYTQEQVDHIFSALTDEIKTAKAKFDEKQKEAAGVKFDLK